jgi:transcriptional regulator of heat shock response
LKTIGIEGETDKCSIQYPGCSEYLDIRFCSICECSFCENCFKQYHLIPKLSSHRFELNIFKNKCSKHFKEIEGICIDCNTLTCSFCLRYEHKNHKIDLNGDNETEKKLNEINNSFSKISETNNIEMIGTNIMNELEKKYETMIMKLNKIEKLIFEIKKKITEIYCNSKETILNIFESNEVRNNKKMKALTMIRNVIQKIEHDSKMSQNSKT